MEAMPIKTTPEERASELALVEYLGATCYWKTLQFIVGQTKW